MDAQRLMDPEVAVDMLIELGTTYGLRLLGAIAILVVGSMAVRVLVKMVDAALTRSSVDDTLANFLESITRVGLRIFVYLAALGALGIQTASLIAILGAAGLAVGMALQGTLSNFAAGVMLILFRPFQAGDTIEAAGVLGKVERISIFNTIILTGDNKKIIVPNSKVGGDNITNYTAQERRRVDMVFGIGYDSDLKQAKEMLNDLLRQDDRILADPEPLVAVNALADSSVNFVVRPWVDSDNYWPVFYDFHERVKLAFDEAGIDIPYPQVQVHGIPSESSG